MGPRLVVISRSIEEGIRGSRLVNNTSVSKRIQGDSDLFKIYMCMHGIIIVHLYMLVWRFFTHRVSRTKKNSIKEVGHYHLK